MPVELLWKNTPEDKIGDLDYLVGVVDWELNADPNFYENRFEHPCCVHLKIFGLWHLVAKGIFLHTSIKLKAFRNGFQKFASAAADAKVAVPAPR